MWLSSRFFSDYVDYETIYKIRHKYDGWDVPTYYFGGRNKITNNSIKLTEKVKEQLGLELFPLLIITATKGYMDAGCAVFAMFDKKQKLYLFSSHMRRHLNKSTRLQLNHYSYEQDQWIEIV